MKRLALVCLLLFIASNVCAQQLDSSATASFDDAQAAAADATPSQPRPPALMPLYLSFAALQMFDVHSTVLAVNRGAHELNPLIRSIDADPVALTAFKLGTTAATIALSEKLWRSHNRTAAVMSMIAVNTAYAFIVTNNYRTANRLAGR